MPKSIAEMRSSTDVGRPESSSQVCVAGKLQAELERIDRRLVELATMAELAQQEAESKPRRLSDSGNVGRLQLEADELAELADQIRDRMYDHMATVTVRAKDEGAWRNWRLQHPPRDGVRVDQNVMVGVCNADDLIGDLESYVIAINGEDPGPGDWEFIRSNASQAALLELARDVLALHEVVPDLGKSRRVWLASRTNETASTSPSASASASDG